MKYSQAQNFFYGSNEVPNAYKVVKQTHSDGLKCQSSYNIELNDPIPSQHQLTFKKRKQIQSIKVALKKFNQTIKDEQIRLFGLQLKPKGSINKSSKTNNYLQNLFSRQKEAQSQQELPQSQQTQSQSKIKVSGFEKYYLSGCYLLFQWKLMKPQQVDAQVQRVVDSVDSNQIQSIRIVGTQIKFDKLNKSLVYTHKRGNGGQWHQEKLIYIMDTVDRQHYFYKDKRLSVQDGPSYTYDSEILQVENRQAYLAIRTKNQVYISFNGVNKAFKIKSSFIKWGAKGLYVFAQESGILLIQRQKYFTNKLNEYHIQQGLFGNWAKGDLLVACGSQMIHGTFTEKDHLFLRVIGGQSIKVRLDFNQDGNSITFAGGFSYGNKVTIIVLTGKKSRIQQMYEYQFLYI